MNEQVVAPYEKLSLIFTKKDISFDWGNLDTIIFYIEWKSGAAIRKLFHFKYYFHNQLTKQGHILEGMAGGWVKI